MTKAYRPSHVNDILHDAEKREPPRGVKWSSSSYQSVVAVIRERMEASIAFVDPPFCTYGYTTTNHAESLNRRILSERRLNVWQCVHGILGVCRDWLNRHFQAADRAVGEVEAAASATHRIINTDEDLELPIVTGGTVHAEAMYRLLVEQIEDMEHVSVAEYLISWEIATASRRITNVTMTSLSSP